MAVLKHEHVALMSRYDCRLTNAATSKGQTIWIPSVSKQGRLDIAVVVHRIGRKATALIDELFKDREASAPFSVLRRRLQALGGSV